MSIHGKEHRALNFMYRFCVNVLATHILVEYDRDSKTLGKHDK